MPTLLVPREIAPGETRVAASPETVKRYIKQGFRVLLEAGAGDASFFSDDEYRDVGAEVSDDLKGLYEQADVVVKVQPPVEHEALGCHEVELLKEGCVLVSFLWPLTDHALVKRLQEAKVTAFAMDLVPRITRAQVMDALSSQSNIAGYKSVLLGANALPKLFPMMMTAAGTIKPARVVIMGAGVAGLQAIATAKRLGAVVEVSDIRLAVKEQVESLGATFIMVDSDEDLEGEGGYAKEASPEFLKKQQEVVERHIASADVVVTTALIPGRPAPMLIPETLVQKMKKGAVIVDIATERGGNCELSVKDEEIVAHGVRIIGHSNLPALQPNDASAVYARNIEAVMKHLYPKPKEDEEFGLKLDWEDEITAGSVFLDAGELKHERVRQALEAQGGEA
jgi:NAD(P) transhydrogenase subunit alpha